MLKKTARRVRSFVTAPVLDRIDRPSIGGPDAATQLLLALEYERRARLGERLPGLRDVGFKAYSQADEDGILWFLFAVLGTTNRTFVELCAGDGIECNAANLALNHGWHGLFVDGDHDNVEKGRAFYARSPLTYVHPPTFAHAWVTRDTVNQILRDHGFEGEIDLLSLDLDGVDYWIWKALEAVQPRVVVVEYQDILGPDARLTVPYSDSFNAYDHPTTDGLPNFAGASLRAFTELAHTKGYRLVGTNRYQYNAFFVRDDLGRDIVPTVRVEDCFTHPKVRAGLDERGPVAATLPWVEVP